MYRKDEPELVPASAAAGVAPSAPITTERRGAYWLMSPNGPGFGEPIPDEPFIVRFDAAENPTYGAFSLRTYEPSRQGAFHEGPESVDGNDEAWLRRRYPNYEVITPPPLLPGQYHPRIWRNGWSHGQRCPRQHAGYPRDLAAARRSAAVSVHRLLEQVSALFEAIEPTRDNADAYGPATRHVLILACTEVEAAWRGILTANQLPTALHPEPRLTTRDYVRLLEPMRLNEYCYHLALYHDDWVDDIAPFANWSAADPTVSLTWYDAYNAAKHDREGGRRRANLRAVLDAVAAACIMLAAQFGERAPEVRAVLDHMSGFEIVSEPQWSAQQLYFPADEHGFQTIPLDWT